jgi:hypothetical protein
LHVLVDSKSKWYLLRVLVQFENTPKAFANFSAGLLQPWVFAGEERILLSRVSQGCRKLQPLAEILRTPSAGFQIEPVPFHGHTALER